MSFMPASNFDELAQQDVRAHLVKVADRIAARAATRAPDGTGDYARSLHAAVDDRGVVAESTDIAGHIIESGSVNNPAYAPLRSAASDVAERFTPL